MREERYRGRPEQLRAVRAALDRTCLGAGAALWIEGEPGIGKTALLDVVEGWARASDTTVLRAGTGAIGGDRPFGVLRALLASAPETVGTMLDPDGSSPDAAGGWVERPPVNARIDDQFLSLSEELARHRPLVLLVDDLQWVDDGSVRALGALASRVNDVPLLLAMAARPARRSGVLEDVLLNLALPVVRLGELPHDAAVQVATDVLGQSVSAELREQLRRADGNPLLVVALADRERELGARTAAAQLEDDTRPPTLARTIRARFLRLDPLALEVLGILAVVGRPISIDVLAGLAERSLVEVARIAQDAVDRELLVEADDGVAFAHDLLREALVDDLSPPVRAALHLHVGRVLLGRSWAPIDVAEYFAAGAMAGDEDSVAVLRSAAAEAERGAPAAAARLLERAVEILPPEHPDALTVKAELAQACVFSADVDRGMRLAEELLGAALPPPVEHGLRNARSQVYFLRGRPVEAAEEFERMIPLVAGTRRASVLLADAAVSWMFAIDLERARRRAEASIADASRTADPIGPVLAHGVLGWIEALGGDLAAGLAHTHRAVALADDAAGLEGHRRIPHLFHAQVLLWSDRTREAERSLAEGRRISAALGMGWDEPMWHALAAIERTRAGEWDDALAEVDAGLRRGKEVGAHFADGWLHTSRAQVALWRGDVETAGHALGAGEEGVRFGAQGADLLWWTRSLASAADGDEPGALASLRALIDAYLGLGTHLRLAQVAPDVARLDRLVGDGRTSDQLVAALEASSVASTALGRSAILWCGGLRAGDTERLRECIGLLDLRCAPLEAAWCRLDLAEFLAPGPDRDRMEAEATAFLQAREVTGTEAGADRHDTGDELSRLTRSERRVAGLIATGMTNGDVAQALSVSRRTIESHLYRIYPKLGVTTRVELALLVSRGRDGVSAG